MSPEDHGTFVGMHGYTGDPGLVHLSVQAWDLGGLHVKLAYVLWNIVEDVLHCGMVFNNVEMCCICLTL